jgi:hypothetical protein
LGNVGGPAKDNKALEIDLHQDPLVTYLLIFFVIAVALAPLSHFVPSKRQREIARMREYAAVHGLFVEFRRLPGSETGPGKAAGGSGKAISQDTIYYGKRLPPAKSRAVRQQAWLRHGQEWRGLGRRVAIPDPLALLPAPVLAASMDDSSCGVYWREAGGEEPVELIRQCLEDWSQQLRS